VYGQEQLFIKQSFNFKRKLEVFSIVPSKQLLPSGCQIRMLCSILDRKASAVTRNQPEI